MSIMKQRRHRVSVVPVVALAVLAAAAPLARAAPPLPTLPDRWSMTLEINMLESNTTMQVEEVYDYELQMARRLSRNPDNTRVETIDFFEHMATFTLTESDAEPFDATVTQQTVSNVWHVLDTGEVQTVIPPPVCTVDRIGVGRDSFTDSSGDMTMKTPQGMLQMDPIATVYAGQERVRGRLCNVFEEQVDQSGAEANAGGFALSYLKRYYFTAPEWNVYGRADSDSQLPVRVEVEGNAFAEDGSANQYFHHYYEFLNVWLGARSTYSLLAPALDGYKLSELECDHTAYCAAIADGWHCDEDSARLPLQEQDECESVGGVSVVLVIIGMLIGAVIVSCGSVIYQRRCGDDPAPAMGRLAAEDSDRDMSAQAKPFARSEFAEIELEAPHQVLEGGAEKAAAGDGGDAADAVDAGAVGSSGGGGDHGDGGEAARGDDS